MPDKLETLSSFNFQMFELEFSDKLPFGWFLGLNLIGPENPRKIVLSVSLPTCT